VIITSKYNSIGSIKIDIYIYIDSNYIPYDLKIHKKNSLPINFESPGQPPSTVASYCRLLDASAFFRGISPLENGDSLGFAWEFHGEKWGFNDL